MDVQSILSQPPFGCADIEAPKKPRGSNLPRKKSTTTMIEWAKMLIRMRARGFMISQLTGLPDSVIRQMWQTVNGVSAPSGQAPSNMDWYYGTAVRQVHSALIMRQYALVSHLPVYAAVAQTYYHYAHLTAADSRRSSWALSRDPAYREHETDYEIPFSRAYELIKHYTDEVFEAGPRKGQRKCELQIRRCNRCGTHFMSSVNTAEKICGFCANAH